MKKFNLKDFTKEDMFRIYYYDDCMEITNQCNISYADWLVKNGHLKSFFTIKILRKNIFFNYYFDIQAENMTNF
jgi:hypothetical protein